MIHVVMGQSWSHQYELIFSLTQIQMDITNIFKAMYIFISQCAHVCFLVLPAKRAQKQSHPQQQGAHSDQTQFQIPFSNKRNQELLREKLTPGLGQGTHRISLEHLSVQQCQNLKGIKNNNTNPTIADICQGAQELLKREKVSVTK